MVDKKLEKDAITGDASAQYALGLSYANEDYAKAVKWYRKAAEQGHAGAQYALGHYYHFGVRLENSRWGHLHCFLVNMGFFAEHNKIEAVKWWRKAAAQNHAGAQNWLGRCYADGDGVGRDVAEAVKWYRKAVEQGYVIEFYNGSRDVFKNCNAFETFLEALKRLVDTFPAKTEAEVVQTLGLGQPTSMTESKDGGKILYYDGLGIAGARACSVHLIKFFDPPESGHPTRYYRAIIK